MFLDKLMFVLLLIFGSATSIVNRNPQPRQKYQNEAQSSSTAAPECCVPEETPQKSKTASSRPSDNQKRAIETGSSHVAPVHEEAVMGDDPRSVTYTLYSTPSGIDDYNLESPVIAADEDEDVGYNNYGGSGYGYSTAPAQQSYSSHPQTGGVEVLERYTKEHVQEPVQKKIVITKSNYLPSPTTATYYQQGGESDSGGYKAFQAPHTNQNMKYVVINKQPKRTAKYQKEYSAKKKVRFPDDSHSQYKETMTEGGESSSYNRGVSYRKAYKQPHGSANEQLANEYEDENAGANPRYVPEVTQVTITEDDDPPSLPPPPPLPTVPRSSPEVIDKISEEPIERSGTYIVSGNIDDGLLPEEDGYGVEYEKEKGKHYKEAHKVKKGEQSEKDYKKKEHYKKAEEKKHGEKHDKGSGSETKGGKKHHVDEGKKFSEGHAAEKDKKSKDFFHKKGHHKGHKKSGYHRVHHKDEFKKDEHFFDEEHDTGEQAAHGHTGKEHAQKHGHKEKGGHHDSKYHEAHHKKHGGHDHGHSYHKQAGHNEHAGHQSHHDHASKHASKEGHKEAEKHGHQGAHAGHYI
ncbi:hypothetical protein LSTR_LSTR016532 [Laodelphax striatellus]|uniref:Uncharacterized protein n=1 Tax=Laodelphax striatellus TaxID=195883 RepID=A0A482WXX2_LAOST|nr:hypothetical protein LSTR_LSTR016532 [Laodelphax striatellus]